MDQLALLLVCTWFCYTDIKYRRISNKITHPLILICLIWRLLDSVYLLGIIPALILFILFLIKPDGIGAGDIKLLAVIGLVVGLQGAVLVSIVMCMSVLIFSLGRKLFVPEGVIRFPLAPFIALGIAVHTAFIAGAL